MALQPTNNLPRNSNKKPQKTNHKVIIIVVAIVIVFIVGMIFANTRSAETENPYATPSSQSVSEETPVTTSSYAETEPEWIYSEPEDITEVPILKDSSFHIEDDAFLIEDDLSFSGVSSLAENNMVYLGNYLTYTPAKSCVFKFSGNNLSISHISGAVLNIRRDKFNSDLDIDSMTAELKQHMAKSHAVNTTIQNVYRSNYSIGVAASGNIDINSAKYNLMIAYAYCSDGEMYTITALAEESSSDFLELLMAGIRINGASLVIN